MAHLIVRLYVMHIQTEVSIFILEFKTKFIHEEIFEWSKKYGPVMTIHIGKSKLCIILNFCLYTVEPV